jgi:hypothetical protein
MLSSCCLRFRYSTSVSWRSWEVPWSCCRVDVAKEIALGILSKTYGRERKIKRVTERERERETERERERERERDRERETEREREWDRERQRKGETKIERDRDLRGLHENRRIFPDIFSKRI